MSITRKSEVMSVTRKGAPRRGRILVVEDDPEAALFTVHVLSQRGRYDVTHTPDPAAALALATSEHWDLVLTDMDLPGMSGLELADALRRAAPGLPVAVVTAHVATAMTATTFRPALAYLEKPLRIEALLATASTLIGTGRNSS
jgi:CheY-like chemotaxis protein